MNTNNETLNLAAKKRNVVLVNLNWSRIFHSLIRGQNIRILKTDVFHTDCSAASPLESGQWKGYTIPHRVCLRLSHDLIASKNNLDTQTNGNKHLRKAKLRKKQKQKWCRGKTLSLNTIIDLFVKTPSRTERSRKWPYVTYSRRENTAREACDTEQAALTCSPYVYHAEQTALRVTTNRTAGDSKLTNLPA